MPHEVCQYVAEQLRGVNRETRTLSIVASDFSLDSYGTRIDPSGWDLEQFRKNGPICVQHDSYSRNGLPVAQALGETVRVDGAKLIMDIRFAPAGADETADRVFELAASGILRGVSVGFEPQEWEDTTERSIDGTQLTVRVYRKQRLLEVSLVTIPSNDNGLVQRAVKMSADEKVVRHMTEQLEESLKQRSTLNGVEIEEKSLDTLKVHVRVTDLDAFQKLEAEIIKYRDYFEKKQPANRESTKVLERFFKKILKTDQPADELEAWTRMGEAVDAMEEKPAEEVIEEIVENIEEVIEAPVVEETPTAPIPEPEALTPERKASVQIPVSELLRFPEKLTKAYMDAAAEALRQGIPRKDVANMIDGMNMSVSNSLTNIRHGT